MNLAVMKNKHEQFIDHGTFCSVFFFLLTWIGLFGDFFPDCTMQGGPLPVISGVISPINGLING